MIGILEPRNKFLSHLLSALFIIIVCASCGEISTDQKKQIDEALSDSLTSTTESWDVDMEILEEGSKKIRLRGSYAATYTGEEQNETRIKGPVNIQVFDSLSNVKTRVSSERAIYRSDEAEFELFGDVKLNTNDNRNLESEYLRWNQNEDILTTPQFVIITTPTDSIAGTGFEGTTDLVDYTIKNPTGRVFYD